MRRRMLYDILPITKKIWDLIDRTKITYNADFNVIKSNLDLSHYYDGWDGVSLKFNGVIVSLSSITDTEFTFNAMAQNYGVLIPLDLEAGKTYEFKFSCAKRLRFGSGSITDTAETKTFTNYDGGPRTFTLTGTDDIDYVFFGSRSDTYNTDVRIYDISIQEI